MKLALFLILSIAVHATVVLVPIAFNGRANDLAVTVTILPLESALEGNGGSGEARAAVTQVATEKSTKSHFNGPGDVTPAALEKIPAEKLSGLADKGVTAIAEVATDGIPTRIGESVAGSAETGTNNFAVERFGAGNGSGSGDGIGGGIAGGQGGKALTQARYRETPQPHYPDSARREGKEGRVLLRVLVDEEGRTKAIEINNSSGYDLLDQAATEAIKKWRFVPARVGGKPIETWVKVPIEFQLSNAKP